RHAPVRASTPAPQSIKVPAQAAAFLTLPPAPPSPPARQSACPGMPAGRRSIRGVLQPAPYARAVATVAITELTLKIGFLAGHYPVVDDEREGHQHQQQPEIVERNRQADQPHEHAEVDGVAC